MNKYQKDVRLGFVESVELFIQYSSSNENRESGDPESSSG
jgi:hypothetical protein